MATKKFPKYSGVFRFITNGNYFNLYVDKNNGVYDITKITVLAWKQDPKRRRKVPAEIAEERDRKLFDMLYGQPRAIVERKLELICELEKQQQH